MDEKFKAVEEQMQKIYKQQLQRALPEGPYKQQYLDLIDQMHRIERYYVDLQTKYRQTNDPILRERIYRQMRDLSKDLIRLKALVHGARM